MRENMALFLEVNGSVRGGRNNMAQMQLPQKRFFINALRLGLQSCVRSGEGRFSTGCRPEVSSNKTRYWLM